MHLGTDVNTIFAYEEISHKHYKKTIQFLVTHKRSIYVLLNNVKKSFLKTYSDYLKDSCDIITQAIVEFKEIRNANPSRKPSHEVVAAEVNSRITKKLEDLSQTTNANIQSTKNFIDKLLIDYSPPKLYEEDEALPEFREKYIVLAEKQATDIINRFLKNFAGFISINLFEYEDYDETLDKIKKIKNDVFANKQDYEDMKIAAEYFCVCKDNKLEFFTFDKEFHRSLHKCSQLLNVNIGRVHLL